MSRLDPNGRWDGAVTSRALPSSEEEVASLSPALRASLGRIWWMQAATEARVAHSFQLVHASLAKLGANEALVQLAHRAIDDEHRHASLCEELTSRYVGNALGAYVKLPDAHPLHATAKNEEERAALYVVGQCALNETFASAYLTAAREECTSPLGRAALRELLADEIDHARVGWAYLMSASAELRVSLSDWILPLTVCNLREWQEVATQSEGHSTGELAAHGVPRAEAIREALEEAVSGVLLPGFAHVGLDTRAMERWAQAGMAT